jgi:hypothetical protein
MKRRMFMCMSMFVVGCNKDSLRGGFTVIGDPVGRCLR